MLSPTSQKNVSEEDSSGSDAGSEFGPELETDRFGFILTNGSTAGTVGPPPELVRQRETKWIHIISQWDRILLKKTSKVKVQCQKGIPASLRAKCWPLLCGATDKMKQSENLFQSLDSQSALQSWVDVIERDLDRQFPFHEMFLSKDGHGQRGLFRVLKAYTQYQPEEGYCQAQGPVAAVLLMNMPAEEAFWCLAQISEQYLPGYYSPLLEGVLFDAAMLTWVLKRTCPAAHKHLQHHGVEPLMFATDWLMCLFTRHLPFNTLLRVWDLFFCHGVRVLLQVAAVLVRRVLGRAEQRKQCQGQMETLERLRGVREEVQEEDDTFIAEVCSVQLSARDLEKQSEKELQKWRKDRPSSTFDPTGRCQGYRIAWARARQNEEERDRNERKSGNLSIPLARSASLLSLSPSLLHRRWRKGGRESSREWDGGRKVVRNLSMGAKEDCRSWAAFNFKKVEEVQEEEDVVLDKHEKLTGQTEKKELLEEPKEMNIQNMPTEHLEETFIVKEPIEQVETRITEKEESQHKEKEESKMLSEQTEETTVETKQSKDPVKDQTVENILQPAEHKHGEELDSCSQSPVLEQQSHESKNLEIEVKDTNKETEQKESESEHTAAVEQHQTEIQEEADADKNTEVETEESVYLHEEQSIQADMKPEESTETENVQQLQMDTVTTETSTGSETGSEDGAPTVQDPTVEMETQQQEVITETDKSSQGDAFEGKYHIIESLAEKQMKEESHTQTVTETEELAQTQEKGEENEATQELEDEIIQIDSEQHKDSKTEEETLILHLAECIQPKESTDSVAERETEAEIPVANDTETKSSEGFGKECDAEPTQVEEERCLTAYSEAQVGNDQTQAEETPTETETTDWIAPPQAEAVTLTAEPDGKKSPAETETADWIAPPQAEAVTLTAEPDGKKSPAETETTDWIAPPQPEAVTLTAEPDGKKSPAETETADWIAPPQAEAVTLTAEPDGKKNPAEKSTSKEPAPEQPTCQVSMGAVQEEESPETVNKNTVGEDDVFISSEPTDSPNKRRNSDVTQASGHHSSRSSGDFCVRKSSNSHGSRLARRLSEDLFSIPEKTSQSQSTPDHTEVKHSAVNPTHSPPDATSEVTSSRSAVTERMAVQQEQLLPDPPKRFGFFRRLRGEQPKMAKGIPKMEVPKILIQDFSDGTGLGKVVKVEVDEKLSSRERRRRRRERERREKEEERSRKKREKELGKERERERRKLQTKGKGFQVQTEKGSSDRTQPDKTGSQTLRYSVSHAESYF
ncbi:fibrous sheath CABYR-binding protein [Cottoperca gobio]|uniref:Fibrous sheath CABYR-binding protein-like n=1 Tax=Cottoperca gobio TaxID=56716 RepID=A0A6J2QH73_COTGO|nr:fibrous sheath CABYR-binding protein-like [Cottoperca gobio]XP_029296962.1 fibrous sheath CABYR-binding protein-like [Cottoperca gobio]